MYPFWATTCMAPLPSLILWLIAEVGLNHSPKTWWQIRLYQLCAVAAIFGLLTLQAHVAFVTGLRKHHPNQFTNILLVEWVIAIVAFAFSYFRARKRKS